MSDPAHEITVARYRAYRGGHQAYERGGDACPFRADSELRRYWADGWTDAERMFLTEEAKGGSVRIVSSDEGDSTDAEEVAM